MTEPVTITGRSSSSVQKATGLFNLDFAITGPFVEVVRTQSQPSETRSKHKAHIDYECTIPLS